MNALKYIKERNAEQMKLVDMINSIEIECKEKHCLVTVINALFSKLYETDRQKAFGCIECLFDEFVKPGPFYDMILEAKTAKFKVPRLSIRKEDDRGHFRFENLYGSEIYGM